MSEREMGRVLFMDLDTHWRLNGIVYFQSSWRRGEYIPWRSVFRAKTDRRPASVPWIVLAVTTLPDVAPRCPAPEASGVHDRSA